MATANQLSLRDEGVVMMGVGKHVSTQFTHSKRMHDHSLLQEECEENDGMTCMV
jgi:hypothetical protein